MSYTAQLVVFLDKSGNFHAELPGLNGARVKVHLGEDFRQRNPEITCALLDAQSALDLRSERIAEELAAKHNLKSQGEKLAELAREREARFDTWIETLPKDRRESEIRKRNERLKKAAETADATARDIYYYTASRHDVDLADRIISDAKRRPRKVISISVNGTRKEISPQTGTASVNGGKKFDPSLALDL